MSVKITTLIENSPGEHYALKTEHGLSFFIEKDGHSLLFDTGQTGAFLKNAEQLRVDLHSVETVVLSHGHYDHSGGFRALTELTTDFRLLLGTGFFQEKYGVKNSAYQYLGNNFDENFLREQNITYQFVDQPLLEVLPGISVVAHFPRKYEDEVINPRFKVLKDGSFQADPFDDEMSLVVDTAEGVIVLLGCSHPGMKNMLDAVAQRIERPIYGVLGGTHLVESNENSLEMSMKYLEKESLQVIGVSHCTGQKAMERLAASNSRYFNNCTGSSLIVA